MNPQAFGPEPPAPDMKRLLLTVVLCTMLVAVWQMLNPRPPAPVPVQPPPVAAPLEPAEVEREAPAEVVADATPELPAQRHVVETNVAKASETTSEGVKGGYRAILSTKGGQIEGFELTGYVDADAVRKDGEDAPNIELARARHEGAGLLALRSRGGDVQLKETASYELVEQSDTGALFRRTLPSGVVVERSYAFDPKSFSFRHEVTLRNPGATSKVAELDIILVGAARPGEGKSSMFAAPSDQLAGVCRAGSERERFTMSDLEEKKALPGQVRYVGLDRHFFLAALVPTGETAASGCTVDPWKVGAAKAPTEVGLDVIVHTDPMTLAPGGEQKLSFEGYFGPKQLQLLQDAGHELDENIEFGWFGVLSRPMLWVLVKLYELIGNFGIAIILLTFLMKLLTFPLTQKSYVSMQQMKVLAPELKKLQAKYGHDRAALGQKQMDMYKERGINPMAGCFPVLVQMPIWFALYRTLWNSVELYQQPFFGWITDLSRPDMSPIFGWPLLPLVVGVLMLGQTLMQPPPQDQPQMKYVMWGMPIMFTFFMLQMPSGLSVYMITNSILTMAQQFYIKRKYAS
jgi:YidC/Oxa1 family membrane protein insertase